MNRTILKECLGESIGTFILVLFGCGSVAVAVLFKAFNSLLEVAIIWGIAVSVAIFAVRNICPAHLNPAVSFAMALDKKSSVKQLFWYVISQTIGAFFASGVLFIIFNNSILVYEEVNHIVRGSEESYKSAMMFGEYFPNPSFEKRIHISLVQAGVLEAFGTFILVFTIFRLIENQKQIDNIIPIIIGFTVTILICLIAPFTQGGFNPARDFSPRIVAYFGGWKDAAFPRIPYSFLTVYIVSPLIGSCFAFLVNKILGFNLFSQKAKD